MSRMARRPRRGSVDQEQHRPVGRQPARHQVVEQRRRDRRRLGRTFAQSEDVFAPRCVDPQRDHDAVFLEDLAVDADHTQIQLAQRPADECPQLLGRQCHKPAATRRCAMWPARSPRPAPGPACAHTAASTPPRRSPRTCATPTRRWPPPTGSSPPAPRPRRCPPEAAAARPVAPRASRGSPRSRHATRSAQADDGPSGRTTRPGPPPALPGASASRSRCTARGTPVGRRRARRAPAAAPGSRPNASWGVGGGAFPISRNSV